MKKALVMTFLIVFLFTFGCASHTHVVGRGNQSNQMMEARQWYLLFGLVPLNYVDSQAMAGGASDYTIHSGATPVDILLNIFTSFVTVSSRTVTVVK